MLPTFNLPDFSDWYWSVSGRDEVYSSKRTTFVPLDDSQYADWLAHSTMRAPSAAADEDDLYATLDRLGAPSPRYYVPVQTLFARLFAAGKAAEAEAAINAVPGTMLHLISLQQGVAQDDASAIAMIESIGLDPTVLLARP